METIKQIMRNIIYTAAALVLTNITACKKLSSYDYPHAVGTAYDILKNDNNFSYFFTAVDKAGLGDLLKSNEAYTIYAPNNAAFINAGYTLAAIQAMASTDLAVIVKNHIVAGATDVKTISGSQQQTALSGLNISVQKIGNLYYVNGGDILNPSQVISNGFLNVSSTLLVNQTTLNDAITAYTASGNSRLTFLAAAIARASSGSTNFTSLLSGSTPYTLFAPNDGAFIDGGYKTIAAINAANPETLGNILKYHLIAGTKLTTAFDSVPVTAYNGTPIYFDKIPRKVTAITTMSSNFTHWYANGINFGNEVPSNLLAANGAMHIVSRFLPIPKSVTTLDYIKADTSLSMFYTLIKRASQAEANVNFETVLSAPTSSYTVFVVNNAGLRKEGYADIAAINNESPNVLAGLLKFHMLSKRINNINIAESETVGTLLTIKDPVSGAETSRSIYFLKSGGFAVKGSSNITSIPVITANIVTTNGLLNIIGSVLKP